MVDLRIDEGRRPTTRRLEPASYRVGTSMNVYRKRPTLLPWPPFILTLAIIAGLVLGHNAPFHLGFPMARVLGVTLIVAALFIDIRAMLTLRKARTTIWPNRSSRHLVVSGPYGYTRNPIYVANVMLLVGLGLVLGNMWFMPLALADAVLTYFLAIRREENHLIANFGYKYEAYCRAVRRWI
jgi:protein-S-isoprenylcysteine O-methyltransferase Ste14